MGKAKVTGGNQRTRRGKGMPQSIRVDADEWKEDSLDVDLGNVFEPDTNIIPFTKEEVVGQEIFVFFPNDAALQKNSGLQGLLDRGVIREVDVGRREGADEDNPRPMHKVYYYKDKVGQWEDLSRCLVFWQDDKKVSLLTSDKSQWRDDEGVVWPPPVTEAAKEGEKEAGEAAPEEKQGRGGRRGRGSGPAAVPAVQPERRRRGRRGGDVTPPQEQATAAAAQEEENEEEGEKVAPVAEAAAASVEAPAAKPEAPAPGSDAADMEMEPVDSITGVRPRQEAPATAVAAAAPAPAEPAAAPAAEAEAPPPSAAPAPSAVPEKPAAPEELAAGAAPAAAPAASPAAALAPPPETKPAKPSAAAAPPAAEASKKRRNAEEGAGAPGAAATAVEAGPPSKKRASAQLGAKPQDREHRQQQAQQAQQAQRPKSGAGAAPAAAAPPGRLPEVPKTLDRKAKRLEELKKQRDSLQSQLDAVNREAAAIGANLKAHHVKAVQASGAGLAKAVMAFVSEAINPTKPSSLESRDAWITAPAGDLLDVLNSWRQETRREPLHLGPKMTAWMAAGEGGAGPAPASAPARAAPAAPAPAPARAPEAPAPAPAAPATEENDADALPFPSTGDETRDNAIVVLAHSLVTATSAVDAAREMEATLWAKYVVGEGAKEPTQTYYDRVKSVWEGLSPRSATCRPALRFALVSGIFTPSELVLATPEFLAQSEAAAVEAWTAPKEGWLADMLRTVQLPHRTAPPGVAVLPPGQPPAGGMPPPVAPGPAAEDMDLGD